MNRMLLGLLATLVSLAAIDTTVETPSAAPARSDPTMDLGAFSFSLNVQDLSTSREFYQKLGFTMIGGEPSQNWIILRNREATTGLFQDMFEHNIKTFNPGWSSDGEHPESFTDIRDLQSSSERRG